MWGSFYNVRYDPHGIIEGYVQVFDMEASAPCGSNILCAAAGYATIVNITRTAFIVLSSVLCLD